MSYSDKLKDPRWRALRLEIIARDGHKCTACDCTENLHVHHGYYAKNKEPWQYESDTLYTLCPNCHDMVHNVLERTNRYIGLISPKTILSGSFEGTITRFKYT